MHSLNKDYQTKIKPPIPQYPKNLANANQSALIFNDTLEKKEAKKSSQQARSRETQGFQNKCMFINSSNESPMKAKWP